MDTTYIFDVDQNTSVILNQLLQLSGTIPTWCLVSGQDVVEVVDRCGKSMEVVDHVAGKKTGNWLQSCDPQKSDWAEDTEEFFEIVDGVSIIMLQAVQWER